MFASEAYEIMSPLVERLGFVKDAQSDKHFAALVRRESESICTYVFIRDHRSGQGSVSCQFWVAPVDRPDDALDNLGIGYKIQLAETWKLDDAFLPNVRQRIENLVPHVQGLVDAVLYELENPPYVSKRLAAYQIERRLYRAVISADISLQKKYFDPLWKNTAQVIAGVHAFSKLREACSATAEDLLNADWIDRQIGPDAFSTNIPGQRSRLIGMSLSSHFYIETLAPWPREN